MKLPKIKFRIMTLEENIDTVKWAYYEKSDILSIHNLTIQYFEELATIDNNLTKEEMDRLIEEVVKKKYKDCIDKIELEVERYNNLWNVYNDEYLSKLSDYLQIDWPTHLQVIEGKVGLIPVFPRYLDSFSFSISINVEDWKAIEVCAHETLHFLWFEKWRKIHPETPRREYDFPYITWRYSEMVTDPILNNKPFSNLFNFEEHSYDHFYDIYDGNDKAMDKLRNIYSKNIPIDEKIDLGFKYIKDLFKFEK